MKTILFFITGLCTITSLTAQDFAHKQLEESPRHHEWVEVTYDDRTVHSFVAYPEKAENTLAVIVIHENRGLNDWARSFADQVAEAGYLAIAPDLLSEFNEDIQKTTDFESSDAAREGIYQLDPEQVTADLTAVQQYAAQMPASNGKTVVAGFCWGGSQSFRFATNNSDIKAALVFYGSAPDKASEIEKISAPVYGFYGENDQRINSGIPKTEKLMKAAGKTYKYEIYKGAGHAYMRAGDDPDADEASKAARDKSWERLKKILQKIE